MENEESVSLISERTKTVTSCAIWFCTFSFGLAYNFLSPALVELKNKYNTTIDDISTVFTIILLAYLVGAITCGVLFNYLSRQLMVVGLLYIMAAGTLVIPYLPTKTQFFVVGGFVGFGSGGYDTSQVVWMLEMWHGKAGPYVQTQYFFFALGTLIAPILIRPFLLEENTNTTAVTTTAPNYGIYDQTTDLYEEEDEESQLYIPLSIGGGIIILAATIVLGMFFFKKYQPVTLPAIENSQYTFEAMTEGGDSQNRRQTRRRIILIILSAIVLGCYQGMEICTFQFLPTFTHYIGLQLPEQDGALVLSGFTGAFTAGRFLGIWACINEIKPVVLLLCNFILTVAGNVILLVFSDNNLTLLWVGAALLGLGYSTVFASIYDHIEKHVRVTNIVAAIMVVAGGLVAAIYPLIVGDSVEHSPFILMYTIFFSIFACTVSFSAIYYLTIMSNGKKYEGRSAMSAEVEIHAGAIQPTREL